MKTILLFAVPPFVGAVIGFITNVVAIRMLFRPLREVRVFGVRLPFTPGILPRQRSKLAQSIGAMAERELFTSEIIKARLASGDVREKIKAHLSLLTEKALSGPPGALVTGGEVFLRQKVLAALEKLYPRAASALVEFLGSGQIRGELETRGRVFLGNVILKLNVFQRFFISAVQYDLTLERKMPEIVEELIDNAGLLLQDAKVKKKLIDSAAGAFDRMMGEQNIKAMFDIYIDDKKRLDDFLFEKLMSAADAEIESLLGSINVRNMVAEKIDSLDMLRVERIILDVMADQLKWIDVFGAILGFLIGLFQAVFSWLMR